MNLRYLIFGSCVLVNYSTVQIIWGCCRNRRDSLRSKQYMNDHMLQQTIIESSIFIFHFFVVFDFFGVQFFPERYFFQVPSRVEFAFLFANVAGLEFRCCGDCGRGSSSRQKLKAGARRWDCLGRSL